MTGPLPFEASTLTAARPHVVWQVLPWSPNLPAGVSIVVTQLQREWLALGMEAAIVVADWHAPTPVRGADGHLRFRFACFGDLTPAKLLPLLWSLPLQLRRTGALLRRERVTAVDFHYVGLDAVGVALLKRLGLYRGRLVLSFHGTDVRRSASALERGLWRWLLASADAVTACSSALAAELSACHGEAAKSCRVIHNGVDARLFTPRPDEAEPPPVRRIVSIGSYIPRKGHRLLLEAWARLAQDDPLLELVIAGQDGDERATLQAAAAARGLSARLTCHTDLTPAGVAALLREATVCVQPSLQEPFGMAVIEAGACAVPVIASAAGGHVEILDAEVSRPLGRLFAVGDVDGCTAALREVLDDLPAARVRAKGFRTTILQRFSWAACARLYALALVGPTPGVRRVDLRQPLSRRP